MNIRKNIGEIKEGNIMRKKICEFRAKNSIKNKLLFIEVEYYKGNWWHINYRLCFKMMLIIHDDFKRVVKISPLLVRNILKLFIKSNQ